MKIVNAPAGPAFLFTNYDLLFRRFQASKMDRKRSKNLLLSNHSFEVKMKFRKFLCAIIVALFSLQTLQFTARADEGMWPFNNLPRAEIKRKYGFEITDGWLKK